MLRAGRLTANPVMLSTKEHGIPHPQYPMLERFNYIVCQTKIKDAVYYLDASSRYLGFGQLQPRCYNGMARVISETPQVVYLNADQLQENTSSSASLVSSPSGLTGNYRSILGYNSSWALRKDVLAGKDGTNYFAEEEKKYADEVSIKNGKIDSLKNFDKPVEITYDVNVNVKKDQFIYLNPMLAERMRENPFKAQSRIYPVELPYVSNDTYNFTVDIPPGYKVDELPKSQTIAMTDGKARFEYQISQDAKQIKLTCRFQLGKIFYPVSEYQNLREFFAQIIKKEAEQIVFKKG
jgi:hypothetical protein